MFTREYGLGLVGGCCGTTPEHLRQVVERVGGRDIGVRRPRTEPGASSIYQHMPFRQDTAYLSIGERTNANGSKAFRDAMLEQRWDDCVEIAQEQIRTAPTCSTCASTTSDATASPTCARSSAGSPPRRPSRSSSTRPSRPSSRPALEMLGGRGVVNSVNYEDGDGPGSRIQQMMPIVKEHGAAVVALTIDEEGQARTAEWKVRVADRLDRAT